MGNENRRGRRRDRLPFGDRPSPVGAPPDRDSPRQYLLIGLVFAGLVTAGVLIGVFDEGEGESTAPVGSPTAGVQSVGVDASTPAR